jgi:hypothetical protein
MKKMTVVPFIAPHPPVRYTESGYCNGYVAVPKSNKLWGITDFQKKREI